MSDETDTQRRAIADEALGVRWQSVAGLGALEDEPRGGAAAWPLGLGRLLTRAAGKPLIARRRIAVAVAAVAMAWVEAIDRELGG